MTVSRANPAPESPPYWAAAGLATAVLVLYIVTIAPTTQFWDTSEYIAAAYTLGIPHPPGNPLIVLMAHVWGMIPWVQNYAERINLFAAATSAVSAGCWFLIGERWLRSFVPARWPRRLAALAGAIVAATAFTVWNQSVVNEKVYTLSLLSIALILWLIVRWDDQPAGQAHDHYLLLIVYLLALTSTNHMMGVLVGPVVIVLLFPPLKPGQPLSSEERDLEWSQFFVFTSIWALIMSLGMEQTWILIFAGILFLAAGDPRHPRVQRVVRGDRARARGGRAVRVRIPADPGRVPPADQRGRAHQLACAVGGADAQAVRQAVDLFRPDAGAGSGERPDRPDPVVLGSARQLLAILQLAIRARLGAGREKRHRRRLRAARVDGRLPALARRQAHGPRHDGAGVLLHLRADLLSQLQVRLLAEGRCGRGPA